MTDGQLQRGTAQAGPLPRSGEDALILRLLLQNILQTVPAKEQGPA